MSEAGQFDAVFYMAAEKPSDLTRLHAVQAGRDLALLAKSQPRAKLMVGVGGWDDDVRELMDIPEVLLFLEWMAKAAEAHGFLRAWWWERIMPETRALMLLAAGLIGRGQIQITTEGDGA